MLEEPRSAKRSESKDGTTPQPAAEPEERLPFVFGTVARAKKCFKAWDLDGDKHLSLDEFKAGCRSFLTEEFQLTDFQLECLFHESDYNKDNKLSWPEFQCRLAGGLEAKELSKPPEKKPTLPIQIPKRPLTSAKSASSGLTLNQLKIVLESAPRLGVDTKGAKAVNASAMKKLLTAIVNAEKAKATADKREVASWAVQPLKDGGVSQKEADKLMGALDSAKTGAVDVLAYLEKAKKNPTKDEADMLKKKKKEEKKSGPQSYTMTTVKPEFFMDWLNERLFSELSPDFKCHPAPSHWGDDLIATKSLNSAGYRIPIFLSDKTKVKASVQLEDRVLIFASFRTEYTSKARVETLWHVRLIMSLDEEIEKVECKEKKVWVDGEIDHDAQGALFEEWLNYCGDAEDPEEQPIPVSV